MKPLKYVGKDEFLTTNQGKYLLSSAVGVARREFKARRLFGTPMYVPKNTLTFAYNTLTEMAAARTDAKYPGKESLDIINLTESSVNIPIHHKEFEIPKADVDASNESDVPLPTRFSDAATYQVGYQEDYVVINGDGKSITGLYAAAGNSEASSYNWSTATNIPLSINAAITLFQTDKIYGPYNLFINPTEEGEAMQLIANTAVPWMDWILKRIGGQVIVSDVITAGTGLMLKANKTGMYDLVVAEDITVETEQQGVRAGRSLFGRVYARSLPVVFQANALCKMTTI